MHEIAFCLGSVIVPYDVLFIALSALVCLFTALACYTGGGGRGWVLWLLTPVMWALAYTCARSIYWACHGEQFSSLSGALTDPGVWGYGLCGVPLGYALTARLARLVRLERRPGALTDALAPGLALGLAVLRLGAAFNGGARGKVLIRESALQRLPFAFSDANGDYRFAAFFAEALLFALFALVLLAVFCRRTRRQKPGGEVFRLFLLLYSLAELVIDSTRNDALYFSFNAFISVAQIVAAVTVLVLLVFYSVRAVRRGWPGRGRWAVWGLYVVSLVTVGVCEYMVQRHGNRQLLCYALMTLGCVLMFLSVHLAARKSEQR